MIIVSKVSGLNLPISSIGKTSAYFTPRFLQTLIAKGELSMATTSNPVPIYVNEMISIARVMYP